jgi:hypothetical protein
MHRFSGRPARSFSPIGLPPLEYLGQSEPTPEYVKEFSSASAFPEGFGYDTGDAYTGRQ